MSKLGKLHSVVQEPMSRFKELYKETLICDTRAVNQAMSYIRKSQGKHMRPLLTMLSSGLCGEVNDDTITSAVLIELIHTASLVHDDIVDEAFERRSMWSVAALWRSRSAVLLGDYILARGICMAVKSNMYELLAMAGSVIEKMSQGELLQSSYAVSMDIDEQGYFEVVRCKTATLISVAAAAGAMSSGASKERVEALSNFGRLIGEAFQIKDDILDYTATNILGKPRCNDIRERKITLPLIYALNGVDNSTRKEVLKHVKRARKSSRSVVFVRDFVVERDGCKLAMDKMISLKEEALALIAGIEESVYKEALINFAEYTLSRDK